MDKRNTIAADTAAVDLEWIIYSANLGLNTFRPPDDATFDVTISYKSKTWISKDLSFQNGGSSHVKASIQEIKRRSKSEMEILRLKEISFCNILT